MPFFHYSQNNSGGSFDFDEARGITHHVIIEAHNAEHADNRAMVIGIYFDGCEDGRDCKCCGDRWYKACGQGNDVPMVYADPVDFTSMTRGWMEVAGKEVAVHYLDGRMVWCGAQ